MSADAIATASLMWSFVFVGVGVFFFVSANRYTERGYELLGSAMLVAGIASAFNALMNFWGPGVGSFFAGRGAMAGGLLSAALNLHFLFRFCGRESLRAVWAAYVLVGAAVLTLLITTFSQLPVLESLEYPRQYHSPAAPVTAYSLATLIAHYIAYVWVLFGAWRGRRKGAGVLFLAVLLLVPGVVGDAVAIHLYAQKLYAAELAAWIYCLVVLASLLSEIHGAQGLLKETTSSLAERTAELEISYAEIDHMHTELSKKQQLAAVGELAAAIAHEVRNPLAIIMNAVSAMRRPTISSTDRETLLSIVNEESERLNHLVTELLRFARPVAASPGPASLFAICQRASQSPPDGYLLEVATPEDDELGPVLVDPGLFRLALDNLVANSVQAMPEGGTIELTVRSDRFADGTPSAAVEIRDSGCGMKDAELEGARKPFFTTKPRGTGLGIPIADRIVDAHGGEMTIESQRGEGTTITIKLPIEKELQRPTTYPGTKHPSTRRRLRSIPPGQLVVPPEAALKEKDTAK